VGVTCAQLSLDVTSGLLIRITRVNSGTKCFRPHDVQLVHTRNTDSLGPQQMEEKGKQRYMKSREGPPSEICKLRKDKILTTLRDKHNSRIGFTWSLKTKRNWKETNYKY